MKSNPSPRPDVLSWLLAWQDEVQRQQFETASSRFASDVYSFGTVMTAVAGRDALMEHQWRAVWPRTRGFRFLPESVNTWGDEQQQVVAAQWVSEGLNAADGTPFERLGRATIVLQRDDDRWLAVHTHFSVHPSPERFLPSTSSL